MQNITKIRTGRFAVEWTQRPQEKLTVDFLPLIKAFKLQPPFCLLHWQAKPKGLRRWGIYDGLLDRYIGCDWNQIAMLCTPRAIEIDENKNATVPTAVLLFDGCQLEADKSNWRIGRIGDTNGGIILPVAKESPNHETANT